MSTWRRKALELFPDLRPEIQRGGTTIYTVFFDLLSRCQQAHRENNEEELRKIYGYAQWCFEQKAKDLWNAAGVAFYEHLVDQSETRDAMKKWITPQIFEDIAVLLEFRIGSEEFAKLKKQFYS
ncbi:hypothetical protein IAD21_01739 [Abditibacteriota bacterium]|nr:hypothetical protein IAD21_01739 [Abditibacteriota bacterium]